MTDHRLRRCHNRAECQIVVCRFDLHGRVSFPSHLRCGQVSSQNHRLRCGLLALAGERRARHRERNNRTAEPKIARLQDTHRDGKRFVVCEDEKLTAFVALERAIYEFAVSLIS